MNKIQKDLLQAWLASRTIEDVEQTRGNLTLKEQGMLRSAFFFDIDMPEIDASRFQSLLKHLNGNKQRFSLIERVSRAFHTNHPAALKHFYMQMDSGRVLPIGEMTEFMIRGNEGPNEARLMKDQLLEEYKKLQRDTPLKEKEIQEVFQRVISYSYLEDFTPATNQMFSLDGDLEKQIEEEIFSKINASEEEIHMVFQHATPVVNTEDFLHEEAQISPIDFDEQNEEEMFFKIRGYELDLRDFQKEKPTQELQLQLQSHIAELSGFDDEYAEKVQSKYTAFLQQIQPAEVRVPLSERVESIHSEPSEPVPVVMEEHIEVQQVLEEPTIIENVSRFQTLINKIKNIFTSQKETLPQIVSFGSGIYSGFVNRVSTRQDSILEEEFSEIESSEGEETEDPFGDFSSFSDSEEMLIDVPLPAKVENPDEVQSLLASFAPVEGEFEDIVLGDPPKIETKPLLKRVKSFVTGFFDRLLFFRNREESFDMRSHEPNLFEEDLVVEAESPKSSEPKRVESQRERVKSIFASQKETLPQIVSFGSGIWNRFVNRVFTRQDSFLEEESSEIESSEEEQNEDLFADSSLILPSDGEEKLIDVPLPAEVGDPDEDQSLLASFVPAVNGIEEIVLSEPPKIETQPLLKRVKSFVVRFFTPMFPAKRQEGSYDLSNRECGLFDESFEVESEDSQT